MIIKCGRKVKIGKGSKTQTVNICTKDNVHGLYDYIIRFRPPSINEDILNSIRAESVEELVRHLEEQYDGIVEEYSENYEPLNKGSAYKRHVKKKDSIPPVVQAFPDQPKKMPKKSSEKSVQIEKVREISQRFSLEFIKNPYLCYTEHGLHARFYMMFYNALSAQERYFNWGKNKVCTVQKEYPTAGHLGRSRRQNWDISVIKTPPQSIKKQHSYDYLRLAAVVEFGLNERKEHLMNDVERICHADANVDQGFIIHLYRISEPGAQASARDWSSNSTRILSEDNVAKITAEKSVEILCGMYDVTGTYTSGLWFIRQGEISQIK